MITAKPIAVLCTTILAAFAMFAVGAVFTCGSLPAATARLRGYWLFPTTSIVSTDQAVVGEKVIFRIPLRNIAHRDVRVVGAKASCGCVAVDTLPLTISPGKTAEMTVWFIPAQSDADKLIEHSVELVLDVDGRRNKVLIRAMVSQKAVATSGGAATAMIFSASTLPVQL